MIRLRAALVCTLWLSTVAAAQRSTLQPDTGRECVVCHLSWHESFNRRDAITLLEKPDETVVSSSDMCLGCHDASVGDERRRVWIEHGHQTGVKPSIGMQVPNNLPLTNGQIQCRTCHTAHAGGPENLANTVFLRIPNDNGQLCIACHKDYTGGVQAGSHPLGAMKHPLAEALKAAGAHAGRDDRTLNCQTCHTPHGQKDNKLLVLSARDTTLCLSCHQQLTPALWRPGRDYDHPQNPPLSTPAQHAAIERMDTVAGPNDTLVCLSCHKIHDAHAGRYLLADTMQNSQLCINCHPNLTAMFGSGHDLRTSAPDALNLMGQTPETSGPCGACHSFHKFARKPAITPADPSGLCVTCHQAGQCAEKKTGQPISHPTRVESDDILLQIRATLFPQHGDAPRDTIACLTCHDPHEKGHPHFLRKERDQLCADCHADQFRDFGRQHDMTRRPDARNARNESATEVGNCGFCHGIHNAPAPALLIGGSPPPQNATELCTTCHRADGLAARKAGAGLRHPHGSGTTGAAHNEAGLPLYDGHGNRTTDGAIACGTCHDPHGGKRSHDLLRAAGDRPADLCLTCHVEARPLEGSLHAQPVLARHKLLDERAHACAPCHSAHEVAGMASTGMWSGPLGPDTHPDGVRECTGCHQPGGGAKPIEVTQHPPVFIQNVAAPGTPGYLPLLADDGSWDPSGQIACATCHLPHGRHDVAPPEGNLLQHYDVLRAARPMVRPYVAPNICSNCHGFDGLRRYLYYHDPARRGPSE